MSHSIILPRLMEIGDGAIVKLPAMVRALGCSQPLIITDKTMVALGQGERIASLLVEEGFATQIFDDTIPEPTDTSIEQASTLSGQATLIA